jgi:HK97 family phage prohead protease
MKIERRVVTGDIEVRQLDDGGRQYSGYAIRFGQPSENLGGFIEYVDADCEIGGADVRHLINHDANLVLGRTTSGTTRLERDDQGVRVLTDLPDTSYARDLEVSIERGDVSQMSFGFRVVPRADGTPGDSWDFNTTPATRHLRAIEKFDVSTVTFPAYPSTSAEVRSLLAEHGIEVPDTPDEVREAEPPADDESRAGKSISSANADHVSAIAEAHGAMLDHITALADAADLTESDDSTTDETGDGAVEHNTRPLKAAELRIAKATAGIPDNTTTEGR